MDQVVSGNILANECYSRALPDGASPAPVCFKLAREGAALPLYASQDALYAGSDILVGIETLPFTPVSHELLPKTWMQEAYPTNIADNATTGTATTPGGWRGYTYAAPALIVTLTRNTA